MQRLIVSALLSLSLLTPTVGNTQAQPAPEGERVSDPKPRPEEPDKQINDDITTFIALLNAGNFLGALPYVMDARFGYYGANEWMRYWQDHNGPRQLRVDKVQVDKLEGDEAQVTVSYALTTPGIEDKKLQEALRLRRRAKAPAGLPRWEGLWAIVVGETDPVLQKDRYSIERAAYFLKQPPGIVARIRSEESFYRLQQLILAALLNARDKNDTFAFDAEYVEEALLHFTRSLEPFTIPGTNEKYAFNTHLSGQSLNKITKPAQTVLFYEGQDGKLAYRYNGKAAVGFADGHVALVDAAGAKALVWTP